MSQTGGRNRPFYFDYRTISALQINARSVSIALSTIGLRPPAPFKLYEAIEAIKEG